MAEKISEKLIIGNALISTKREYLTKGQVYHYWHIVDSLLPDGYYTSGNNNSFSDFCEEYPFLVKRVGDTMVINCDMTLLERYCRLGVPREIIEVFDAAGNKLNEIEASELERINYNEENLEALEKYIEKSNTGANDGKVFRMVENPGNSCEVEVTEKSRKIFVKTLLK